MRTVSVMCSAACFVLVFGQVGYAQVLDGTADLTVGLTTYADLEDEFSVVTYGTFALETPRSGAATLILMSEYGPTNVVESNGGVGVRWAGQLFVEVPILLSTEGYERHFTVGEIGLYASYDEWNSSGEILFSSQSDLGWVDVRVRATSDTLIEVDAEVNLGFVDVRGQEQRSVSGIFFGGRVRVGDVPSSVSTNTDYDRYGHRCSGCGRDTYVDVDTQPTTGRSDSGCAGDDVEADEDVDEQSYRRDSGCGNDSVDDNSGPTCAGERHSDGEEEESDTDEEDGGNETLSCAGDDTSDGYSSDDDEEEDDNSGSDLHCAGDDIDSGSASVIPIGRSLQRNRRPLSAIFFRTLHMWSPFVFIFLFRRRHRRG